MAARVPARGANGRGGGTRGARGALLRGRSAAGGGSGGGGAGAGTGAGKGAEGAWYPLACQWEVRADEAVGALGVPQEAGGLPAKTLAGLPPGWRVMLLSDGSVTRHLQLLTGLAVSTECLEMRSIGRDLAGLPSEVGAIAGPLLQRQVFLRHPTSGEPLLYAASWWNTETAGDILKDAGLPMWVSLEEQRRGLYRELQEVCLGDSEFLETTFGSKGPFWGRSYTFYLDGAPLTVVYEVFSPSLDAFLGPSHPAAVRVTADAS